MLMASTRHRRRGAAMERRQRRRCVAGISESDVTQLVQIAGEIDRGDVAVAIRNDTSLPS